MKYRINKGTETYVQLQALWKRMDAAWNAARKMATSMGVEEWVPPHGLSGGIVACRFKAKPNGWKRAFSPRYLDLYEPMVRNKPVRDRLASLPVLRNEELNSIVGFKKVDHIDEDTGRWYRMSRPGLYRGKDCFLMDTGMIPGSKYTPPNADIVEILESEYERLLDASKKNRKTT